MPVAESSSISRQCRSSIGQVVLQIGPGKAERDQERAGPSQNASVIGGTTPATPRPSTMFPAQNKLARISRIHGEFQKRRMCRSVGARPAVAPRVGAGHAHAVLQHADRLHAARPFQRPDAVQPMAEPFQSGQHIRRRIRFDRQAAIAFMRPVGALALLDWTSSAAPPARSADRRRGPSSRSAPAD